MTDKAVQCTVAREAAEPQADKTIDEEDDVAREAETCAEEGRCYMMDTEFKTPGGYLVAAADLSIGAEVLDNQGNVTTVTWCRKLPKRKRVLVDLHTKPLTVTSTHRVVVPGGEVEARELNQNDEVLIGSECQQLVKVTKRHKCIEVMELEFAGDATVEVHAPSILTKGSDPSVKIDLAGDLKCKNELEEEHSMAVDAVGPGIGSADADSQGRWPDTDDDLR